MYTEANVLLLMRGPFAEKSLKASLVFVVTARLYAERNRTNIKLVLAAFYPIYRSRQQGKNLLSNCTAKISDLCQINLPQKILNV